MQNVYIVYAITIVNNNAIYLDSIWKTLEEAKRYRNTMKPGYGIKEMLVREENYES